KRPRLPRRSGRGCRAAPARPPRRHGHEGVMAKHQTSRYLPGRRSAAWKKIKPTEVLPCVIIGYTSCRDGIHSLLVASVHQGPLRYVGQITSGFSDRLKADLERRLAQRRRPRPVVACQRQALWVEPDFYCRVRFQHWTPRGRLRCASFAGLLGDEKTSVPAYLFRGPCRPPAAT